MKFNGTSPSKLLKLSMSSHYLSEIHDALTSVYMTFGLLDTKDNHCLANAQWQEPLSQNTSVAALNSLLGAIPSETRNTRFTLDSCRISRTISSGLYTIEFRHLWRGSHRWSLTLAFGRQDSRVTLIRFFIAYQSPRIQVCSPLNGGLPC